MKDKILEVLKSVDQNIDFENETGLVDDGILDSITITDIISELNYSFDINIPFEEIKPENFNSLDCISSLVEKLSVK